MSNVNNQPREWYAFLIAAAIISAFVVYFGIALISPEFDTSINDRLTVMKEVTALLGGYVGAVLVYYFSQRQVQNLRGDLRNAQDTARTAQDDARTARENEQNLRSVLQPIIQEEDTEDAGANRDIDEAINEIARYRQKIEELNRQIQALITENEKLKKGG